MMKETARRITTALLALMLLLPLVSCGTPNESGDASANADKSGDIMILFTSDMHAGVDKGFGLAGLQNIREKLDKEGYTTILVDIGDAVQGELISRFTNGEGVIDLMNEMKYDVAVPGNHEYDYGVEQLLSLAERADFQYISCNFNKEGELVFEPYVIKEAAGKKIAFVGMTTPTTFRSTNPYIFQNDKGEFIYDFMQDNSGETLYQAVQKAVDDARAAGADYVYALGHMGMGAQDVPFTYADVIENTNGIDVFLDGHSHDTDQVVMKNKDGKNVVRAACGTKLSAIGYSHISAEEGIKDTDIWTWNNEMSAPELLGIENSISKKVDEALRKVEEETDEVIGETSFDLTINDPKEVDNSGAPIRMVRRADTNMANLVTDAIRVRSGADIGLINGGSIRSNIDKGDITIGDVINTVPFSNKIVMIELSGQQILDALELSACFLPGEYPGFLQCSGITYEINTQIPSACKLEEGVSLVGIEGERRISNVMVGDEPLDPAKKYTVAGNDFIILNNGDGHVAFDNAKLLRDDLPEDNQVVIDYIIEDLDGKIGTEYADPYGDGRIIIK